MNRIQRDAQGPRACSCSPLRDFFPREQSLPTYPGRRVGCGSPKRSVKNVAWQKTARMGTNHLRTWRRHEWHSWHACASSTIGGTVYGVAVRHNCGHKGRETNFSCLPVVGNHLRWQGSTGNPSMLGNLWREESSPYLYVEKMDIASCTVTSPPSSGGQLGYESSFENRRQRHRPMANN